MGEWIGRLTGYISQIGDSRTVKKFRDTTEDAPGPKLIPDTNHPRNLNDPLRKPEEPVIHVSSSSPPQATEETDHYTSLRGGLRLTIGKRFEISGTTGFEAVVIGQKGMNEPLSLGSDDRVLGGLHLSHELARHIRSSYYVNDEDRVPIRFAWGLNVGPRANDGELVWEPTAALAIGPVFFETTVPTTDGGRGTINPDFLVHGGVDFVKIF